MDTITILFTKRKKNLVSWLIRWATPRTRFQYARASHCVIVDGDNVIEATMLHGVRQKPYAKAMKGQHIVQTVHFNVPDKEAGLAWLRTQVGTKYDFLGAFGLALSPDRNWAEDDKWFCFELAAATLAAAGRNTFRTYGHIGENQLLSIKP